MGAVTMFHAPSGQTQRASQDAYERVWKEQGWVLVEQPEVEKPKPRKTTTKK